MRERAQAKPRVREYISEKKQKFQSQNFIRVIERLRYGRRGNPTGCYVVFDTYFRLSNLLSQKSHRFQKMFEGYENSEYSFEELHLSPDDPEIFRPEISIVVEIFIDFDLLSIAEFQIYSFILPILKANIGKILAKTVPRRVYEN